MKSQRVPLLLLAVVAVAIVSVSGEYRFASEKLQRVNAAALHGKHELHVRSVATPLDHFNPRSDETVPLVRAPTHAADMWQLGCANLDLA